MKFLVVLTIFSGFLIANSATAKIPINLENSRNSGCNSPVRTQLEVHATYVDNGTLMCALEVENYSWWDLIDKSYWKADFWFPCDVAGQFVSKGSKVEGILSWDYEISCEGCNPGNHYICTATFELDL